MPCEWGHLEATERDRIGMRDLTASYRSLSKIGVPFRKVSWPILIMNHRASNLNSRSIQRMNGLDWLDKMMIEVKPQSLNDINGYSTDWMGRSERRSSASTPGSRGRTKRWTPGGSPSVFSTATLGWHRTPVCFQRQYKKVDLFFLHPK